MNSIFHLAGYWVLEKYIHLQMIYKSSEDPSYGKYEKGFNSEGVYDRTGSRYYLLMINDFNNNHKNSIISSYQRDTMIDNNVLTKFKYIVDPDYHSVDRYNSRSTESISRKG